jgi:hypothetical protein
VLQLEGYQYDVTGDFLSAQVVRIGPPGAEAERAKVEVPIDGGLRTVIDATVTLLSHALAPQSFEGSDPAAIRQD